MGYTTDFQGSFCLDKPLTEEHCDYLSQFARTRRMKRDPKIAEGFKDPLREKVGLPIGNDGEYFVGVDGSHGQDNDKSVLNYNNPPEGQPGLWCQWVPNIDEIIWDGTEKFYNYVEWIEYIIDHFLKPWGYLVNGEVEWEGEESGDLGIIIVTDNEVSTKQGKITYE